MLKKLLMGTAAVCFAASIAAASNLTIFSGPQDPSSLLATINTLVQNINFGVNGRLQTTVTAAGTTTTIENTMATYTLPANRIANNGEGVRIVCFGTSASNNNTKTATLYFGSTTISTAGSGVSANNFNSMKWRLEMQVMRSGAATQVILGTGAVNNSPLTVFTSPTGTADFTGSIVVKCTGTTPTAAQDITAQGFQVEQVK